MGEPPAARTARRPVAVLLRGPDVDRNHRPAPVDGGAEDVIQALSRAVESLAREIARDLQALAGQAALSGYDLTTIQNGLRARGFDPGPSDGLMGPQTRSAISRYQAARNVQVTGEPSRRLQIMLTR